MNSKIDLSYLEEVTGGSSEIIQEMLELFLSETPVQLESLKEHITQSNWDEIKAEAHKAKPTFLYVGLKNSHNNLVSIENHSRNKENLNEIRNLYNLVEEEFNNVKDEILVISKGLNS
jgi:HPt (histidine-containing phosphotransfer) domain-containing protein